MLFEHAWTCLETPQKASRSIILILLKLHHVLITTVSAIQKPSSKYLDNSPLNAHLWYEKKIYLPQKNFSLTHYEIKIGEYEGSSKLNGGRKSTSWGKAVWLTFIILFRGTKAFCLRTKKEKHEKKSNKAFLLKKINYWTNAWNKINGSNLSRNRYRS